MKRIARSLIIVLAMALLGGCVYGPDYGYVRGDGYYGDAYYGASYYGNAYGYPAYPGGYYNGWPGYYGYGPSLGLGIYYGSYGYGRGYYGRRNGDWRGARTQPPFHSGTIGRPEPASPRPSITRPIR